MKPVEFPQPCCYLGYALHISKSVPGSAVIARGAYPLLRRVLERNAVSDQRCHSVDGPQAS